jgi:hypothetical protein
MLVFGIGVLVRACEADMHDVRRGRNNPCNYYYHSEHRILNEKLFFRSQYNIWAHSICDSLNYSYKFYPSKGTR